jgi:hypothetical protein
MVWRRRAPLKMTQCARRTSSASAWLVLRDTRANSSVNRHNLVNLKKKFTIQSVTVEIKLSDSDHGDSIHTTKRPEIGWSRWSHVYASQVLHIMCFFRRHVICIVEVIFVLHCRWSRFFCSSGYYLDSSDVAQVCAAQSATMCARPNTTVCVAESSELKCQEPKRG